MSEVKISKFQFHKGTIKTPTRDRSRLPTTVFQFHKGTIKTSLFEDAFRLNSISIP